MRMLVIGGGKFLGRSFAEEALDTGHDVTVFNRGETSVDPQGATVIHGDRGDSNSVAELTREGSWDAVIDTCDASPRVVGQNARALADHADSYLFVSSVSAFSDWPSRPVDGDSALLECASDAADGGYGAMKAGAERAVRESFHDRALILYPGMVIGPYEYQGRQTWWLSRMARGGAVVAPGAPEREIRLIDARDIAKFGLSCLAADRHGAFLVTSPPGHVTFGEWLCACAESAGAGTTLRWTPDAVLCDAGVDEWTGLPLWAAVEGDARAVWNIDVSRSLAAGLECRPIRETVEDTWQWLEDSPGALESDQKGRINGYGLPTADEQRILALLAGQRQGG